MSERLNLTHQISAINAACEIISANEASVRIHGWKSDELDAVYIGLGAARATLEWLKFNEAKVRAACAPKEWVSV